MENWIVRKAARMMNAPWATFRIFCTPKIRDSPTAARAKNPPWSSPVMMDCRRSVLAKATLFAYNPKYATLMSGSLNRSALLPVRMTRPFSRT